MRARRVRHAFAVGGGTITATSAGTAGRLTDLGALFQVAGSTDFGELHGNKLVAVRGHGVHRADTADATVHYNYGLYFGPNTLDAPDVDVNDQDFTNAFLAQRREIYIAQEREMAASVFQVLPRGMAIRTNRQRRFRYPAETLWLVESCSGADLVGATWTFDMWVELG